MPQKVLVVIFLILATTLFPVFLHSQDAASQAGLLWKAARAAFSTGDFATSAKNFDSIIRTSAPAAVKWSDGSTTAATPPPPLAKWLEPAFYMLGASYFNLKDWPNSIETFSRYLKLFPQSPRVSEIKYSQAQAQLFGGHPEEAIPILKSLLPIDIYHVRCVTLLAECYKRNKDLPGAISVFETEKKLPNLDPDYLGKINLKLLGLYEDTSDVEKAVSLLMDIDTNIAHAPDIVEFNALATRLGDSLLEKSRDWRCLGLLSAGP